MVGGADNQITNFTTRTIFCSPSVTSYLSFGIFRTLTFIEVECCSLVWVSFLGVQFLFYFSLNFLRYGTLFYVMKFLKVRYVKEYDVGGFEARRERSRMYITVFIS